MVPQGTVLGHPLNQREICKILDQFKRPNLACAYWLNLNYSPYTHEDEVYKEKFIPVDE